MKKTKIVCTLGPATKSLNSIETLINEGMNVARFNFSHGELKDHREHIHLLREASKNTSSPVAVLLDTKGPEMRLGLFKEGKVTLDKGQQFILTARDVMGDKEIVSISNKQLPKELKAGAEILLSDGAIRLTVNKVESDDIYTTVENSGEIGDRKRVAVPSIPLNLPFLSDKDKLDIQFAIDEDVDFIAASFVQRAEDVLMMRKLLDAQNSDIMIISKIENAEGVKNLEEILKISDGLMVARGDLGVEIPAEEVPLIQKKMIRLCNQAGKPVITATQMLESMTFNPRPTRAEASDVANAILDGTDAVMLSAETTIGQYPIEAVKTMSSIAKVIEKSLDAEQALTRFGFNTDSANTTYAICHATVQISHELGAKGVVTPTESGFTARMVSKYRPNALIFAVTPHDRTVRQLQLVWGVKALKGKAHEDSDAMTKEAIQRCLDSNLIEQGDTVVITAGIPIGKTGTTNMIQVQIA